MKTFISVLLVLLSSYATAGKYYKCKDATGATSFQSKPCPATSKQIKKVYRGKSISSIDQCGFECSAAYRSCIAFKNKGDHTGRGGQLCLNERQACHVGCTDPERGAKLSKMNYEMRRNYENRGRTNTATRKTIAGNTQKYSNTSIDLCDEERWRKERRASVIKEIFAQAKYSELSKAQKERVKRGMSPACQKVRYANRRNSYSGVSSSGDPQTNNSTPILNTDGRGGFYIPVAGGYMAPNGGGICQSIGGGNINCGGDTVHNPEFK